MSIHWLFGRHKSKVSPQVRPGNREWNEGSPEVDAGRAHCSVLRVRALWTADPGELSLERAPAVRTLRTR